MSAEVTVPLEALQLILEVCDDHIDDLDTLERQTLAFLHACVIGSFTAPVVHPAGTSQLPLEGGGP